MTSAIDSHNSAPKPNTHANTETWLYETFPDAGRRYLTELLDVPAESAVLIKIGHETILRNLTELVDGVQVLTQLGLYPVIVHGASKQIAANLDQAGVASVFDEVSGNRITTDEALPHVSAAAESVNSVVVDALQARGIASIGLTRGIFTGHVEDPKLIHSGVADEVDSTQIVGAVQNRVVPVVSFMGTDFEGGALNINADSAARALALHLEPHRTLFISDTAPKRDLTKPEIIPVLDASNGEIGDLIKNGVFKGGMKKKIEETAQLVRSLPEDSSVVILPLQYDVDEPGPQENKILRELFSDEGAGTMLLHGEQIIRRSAAEANKRGLKRLVELAFKGTLAPNYFRDLPTDAVVYQTQRRLRSAAIVLPHAIGGDPTSPAYVDKVASDKVAKGKNITRRVMHRVEDEHSAEQGGVFWRARTNNAELNEWYLNHTQAVGINVGKWTVYVSGVADTFIPQCLDYAKRLGDTITYANVT